MTLPAETFQDRAARRREPKALKEGHDAINDLLRQGRPTLEERHAQRVMEDFDQREREFDEREQALREPQPPPDASNAARAAGLDQGSRGGGHAPAPKDGSGALRQALREAREARGE